MFSTVKMDYKPNLEYHPTASDLRNVESTDPAMKQFFTSIKEYGSMDYLNPCSTHFTLENNNALQVRIYLCHWHIKIFLLRGVDLCDIIYFNLLNAHRCVCMHNKT